MARELFVYWKVAAGAAAQAAAATADFQQSLRAQHPGLQARLLQRAEGNGLTATLMETYALPPAGVDRALQTAIEAAAVPALADWCQGRRHVEVFDAVDAINGHRQA